MGQRTVSRKAREGIPVPVMILCGGEGSRLREETELRPKPMLHIGNRPILWHIMKLYASYGLKHFILCLGYKGHMIKDYFVHYRTYSSDLTVQLGSRHTVQHHTDNAGEDWRVTLVETGETAKTGARVVRAGQYLESDTFCLTYGDGLSNIDIRALLAFHRAHGKIGTVTGVRPSGRFGELEMRRSGLAAQFNEKPQATGGLINGGFFVFQRAFLERCLDDRDDLVLEQEPLQRLVRQRQLMVYPHTGFWQPMDTYREFKLLNDLWATGRAPWKVWK